MRIRTKTHDFRVHTIGLVHLNKVVVKRNAFSAFQLIAWNGGELEDEEKK
jgi:hypothetical protein